MDDAEVDESFWFSQCNGMVIRIYFIIQSLVKIRSPLGGVLMNLVNYGGSTNDIDYQDVE